jgi:hypothetical protein
MLETMPANRVAAILTAENIPSPDAGRTRKDSGVEHVVSGVWHSNTVTNIARNPFLLAVVAFGRRSLGDQRRISPNGPRELMDSDFRADQKPKVIRNPADVQIKAPAKFDPLVDVEKHLRLLADLDQRGSTQRGKQRSRDPGRNPFGGRIFDLNCGWLMYRTPWRASFRYVCGLYQKAQGKRRCDHNHVDGIETTHYVLSAIRQRLLAPAKLARLEQKLRDRVTLKRSENVNQTAITKKRFALDQLRRELAIVEANMARAATWPAPEFCTSRYESLGLGNR